MSFIFYDLGLLVLVALIVSFLLYRNKSKIKKEGLAILYKTQWGTRLIEKIGKKYEKTLSFLSYISISIGGLLMIGMLYLFYKIADIYFYQQQIVKAIKIPPIMPLVPYVDKIVPGIPPVYFIYFVIILAVIAIPHEFFHGIFMRRFNIKIKSTGFGFFPFFFPVLPLAFVEQEEKSFEKSSRFEQMVVLSAGTFANVIVALIFFLIMMGFFTLAFTPAGINFDSYAYGPVHIQEITNVNGVDFQINSYENLLNIMKENEFNYITANGINFIATKKIIENRQDSEILIMYYNAPAINSNLSGIIKKINGVQIDSKETLSSEIGRYSPGENILLEIYDNGEIYKKNVILGSNPFYPEQPWLGIGFLGKPANNLLGKFFSLISFKEENVYYKPLLGEFSNFIYYLLWWIAVASISVALVNMLPLGGLDGGRFLYLGIWSLTGKEKFAKKTYVFLTYFLLFILAIMMLFWVKSFFS